jgi:hypothetical protein
VSPSTNIQMMGEIFNIVPSDKALLPWAAYALLLAYSCFERRSRSISNCCESEAMIL